MHRATSMFLCIIGHSHASAVSETIKKCRIDVPCVESIFVQPLSFTIRQHMFL